MSPMPFELDELLQVIRAHVKNAGSLRALAKKWKVTPSYLSDILLRRRRPGPKVLKNMNLVAEIIYRYQRAER